MSSLPVCLTIGGSDSCGGAGIQADLRIFEALGVRGCSATTAMTAQNPGMVARIEPVSLAQLDAELHAVFDYYDIAVVKTGMLLDAEHVAVVAALLDQLHSGPLVVDPVIASTGGTRLLDIGGVDALQHALLPQTTLLTPNLGEASLLLGEPVTDPEVAARLLAKKLDCAVLLKGGHGEGDELLDLLCDVDGRTHHFAHARKPWSKEQLHGTGCRLASAVAAHLAAGEPLYQAVSKSIDFLQGE